MPARTSASNWEGPPARVPGCESCSSRAPNSVFSAIVQRQRRARSIPRLARNGPYTVWARGDVRYKRSSRTRSQIEVEFKQGPLLQPQRSKPSLVYTKQNKQNNNSLVVVAGGKIGRQLAQSAGQILWGIVPLPPSSHASSPRPLHQSFHFPALIPPHPSKYPLKTVGVGGLSGDPTLGRSAGGAPCPLTLKLGYGGVVQYLKFHQSRSRPSNRLRVGSLATAAEISAFLSSFPAAPDDRPRESPNIPLTTIRGGPGDGDWPGTKKARPPLARRPIRLQTCHQHQPPRTK